MPRARQLQMKFFVDEQEKLQITERANAANVSSLSDYLRELALNGFIVNVDVSAVKDLTQEINKIGTNINQIAHRVNATEKVYQADLKDIKESLDRVWQLQRSILLQQR